MISPLYGLCAALVAASLSTVIRAQSSVSPPQVEIANGLLKALVYLPDADKGYYRGTRFDWSGVVGRLEYKGHTYFAPWYTKTSPTISDFVFEGPDIIAGPNSAIPGPVEEFVSPSGALGYDLARPGGTFIKIGVGVLRKPDDQAYNKFRLYDIAERGTWNVRPTADSVEFVHTLRDPATGYGYVYTKTLKLAAGRPEMRIEHSLRNTGTRRLDTSVYDHNFLVLDNQAPGPDFTITTKFPIAASGVPAGSLGEVRGTNIVYKKTLADREVMAMPVRGFGTTADHYDFTIENTRVGAGLRIRGDRPLSNVAIWSIRSNVSLEPFIDMSIEPGRDFTWSYTYDFYLLSEKR